MALALTEDHRALAAVARSFVEERGVLDAARATLAGGATPAPGAARPAARAEDRLPPFWSELAALGWLGLHVAEEYGGQGYGLAELAIVVEELGRAVAPGPFLPTVIAAAVIAEAGSDALRAELLPPLVDGTRVRGGRTRTSSRHRRRVRRRGRRARADLPRLRDGAGDGDLAVYDRSAVSVAPCPSLDPTRPSVAVAITGAPVGVIAGGVAVATRVARALAAVEAAGGVRACLDAAVGYALVREQFGRVIASFQAIKHHCAEMLVDAEMADAAAWDAVRSADRAEREAQLAAAVAACTALPAYRRAAEMNIQIHGGIGYTWEHDAHLYLRRAAALAGVVDASAAAADVTRLTRDGVELHHGLELPPEAEAFRAEAREFRSAPRRAARRRPPRRARSSPGTSSHTGPSRGAVGPVRSSSS